MKIAILAQFSSKFNTI